MSEESYYVIPPPRREAKARRRDLDMEALVLKSRGMSLQEIADYQGTSGDPKKAAARIRRAAATAYRWAVDEQRLLEMMSLDELEMLLQEKLRGDQPYLASARGGVVVDLDGNPVIDRRYFLEVQDRIMRIKERRAKLMGLDAPTRQEISTI